MKKAVLFFLGLIALMEVSAQNGVPLSAGARGAGMGNATVGFQDIYSLFGNPAGLAQLQQTSFVAIGESRFLGFGVQSLGAGVAMPSGLGTFGLALQYFGIEEYKEQKVGLSYARRLFDQLSIAVQFDYLHLQIQDYGSKDLVTFEVGLQSQLSSRLTLGAYVYSPTQVTVLEDENLPTIFKLGALYKVSKKLNIGIEVEKDMDFPAEFHLGIEYLIVEALALRLGTQTQPNELSFGLGYRFQDRLRLDVAATYHQFLGITPTFSAVYLWKK